jgi:IS1 family transposase
MDIASASQEIISKKRHFMLARARTIVQLALTMNQLTSEKRAQLVSCLAEGNSLRATARMTGACFNTVLKFLPQIGAACSNYQDRVFRNLTCKRIQCDEIWAFVGAKDKNATPDKKADGWGSVWTWLAIDADTKLIPCWFIGERDGPAAWHFMHDLAGRLAHRVQLTTDGHKPYLAAVEDAFGEDIDFAQLVKIYGAGEQGPHTRYSPAQCMGTRLAAVTGQPDAGHVSTSYIERANLTLRMGNRRFTRLTNAFSKKVANHEHAVALSMMHYNFCRIHASLRVTPAMQAGVADHVWSLQEVAELLNTPLAAAA